MNESDMLALMRASTLERERIELGYATPLDPDFATNALVAQLGPGDEDGLPPGPRFTFYAQPTAAVDPLDIERVAAWLVPNERRYEPLPGALFVPMTKQAILDGVLAYSDFGDGVLGRFLAVRRTATVEYGAYCAWSRGIGGKPTWMMSAKHVMAQFEQLLRFLTELAAQFRVAGQWQVFCNARAMTGVIVVGFGEGWISPFDFRPRVRCGEDRFQFEVPFGGEGRAHEAAVRELAERLDLAFGSTSPRVYDRAGEGAGKIAYGGIQYS